MRTSRLPVIIVAVAIAFSTLAVRSARAGECKEKLRLLSVECAPDPFSPGAAGSLAVDVGFEARPTDGGAGNKKNGKTFEIRRRSMQPLSNKIGL